MRKLLVVIAVLSLVAVSCGSGDSADSCEGVADDAVGIIQDMIDQFDSMTTDDMMAMASEGEPEAVTEMTNKLDSLQQKAVALGCSDDQMTTLLADRAGNLKAETSIGQMMVDEIQSNGLN
jgi:hypothetical protein